MEIFEKSLKIALDLNKPVTIHCIKGLGDLMKTFKNILNKQPKVFIISIFIIYSFFEN